MIRTLTLCVLLLPTLASAQNPPAAYYTGLYRLIGVGDAGAIDQPLRIDATGETLTLSVCGGTASLTLPAHPDDEPFINGTLHGASVTCQSFNTYGNYPLIACTGDESSVMRLTLWPVDDFAARLSCPD